MKPDQLYLVSHKRTVVSEQDIVMLKGVRDFAFPEDLCNFLRQFGPGEYCGCLSLFGPKALLKSQISLRELYAETYWFDREKSALSQQEILETTWVARTLDGDEVVYQPAGKTGYYVLPRHSDAILRIGNTFDEMFDWFGSAGVMYPASKVKWFCTFKDRCRLHLVQDEEIPHTEALKLVNEAFEVDHAQLDPEEEFSIFFCRKISGYIHVYQDSMSIHHDLDFDSHVCRIAEAKFYNRGFRSVEHYRPNTSV